MSDSGIIRKTKNDGKVVEQDIDDAWFQHVLRYNIFNDDQARLLYDTFVDIQARTRNEREEESKALAEATADFVLDRIGGLPNEVRVLREKVAALEGQLRAMVDLRGVPGARGENGVRGEPGRQGAQGAKGIDGLPGKAAPHWIGVKVDGYDLVAVMSDGTLGPRISLQPMFEASYAQQILART
jgi:hypothetical protein